MSLLELKNESKQYPDGFKINDASFSIEEKGIYGFFAKGKAGKTMLATILCGACEVDSGEILYKDKAMHASKKQTAKIKRKIGYVPDACIFPSDLTVSELLDFTGKAKGVDPDSNNIFSNKTIESTVLLKTVNDFNPINSLLNLK